MLIAAVDICNTIADVLTEIQNIIGPWPFNEYHHPILTDDFFYRHAEIFLKSRPYKGAIQGMWRLKEHFDIVYLSARPKWARTLTELWLKVHGFPDGKLILTRDKAKVAKELKVAIAIEDAPFEIDKLKEAGVTVVVKAQNYNKKYAPRFEWHELGISYWDKLSKKTHLP